MWPTSGSSTWLCGLWAPGRWRSSRWPPTLLREQALPALPVQIRAHFLLWTVVNVNNHFFVPQTSLKQKFHWTSCVNSNKNADFLLPAAVTWPAARGRKQTELEQQPAMRASPRAARPDTEPKFWPTENLERDGGSAGAERSEWVLVTWAVVACAWRKFRSL